MLYVVNTYSMGPDIMKLTIQMTAAMHSVVLLPMRGLRGFIMAMYLRGGWLREGEREGHATK